MPQIMMSAVGDEIVALCITFLRSSEYIKNPYLKSSLVTVLFAGSYPLYHLSRGILGDILIGAEFANEHLLHALMKFYIGACTDKLYQRAWADIFQNASPAASVRLSTIASTSDTRSSRSSSVSGPTMFTSRSLDKRVRSTGSSSFTL
jgi:hypothetical protein